MESQEGPETTTQERRSTTRVDCCYQVDCCHGNSAIAATIVNMGLGGLRLLTPQKLPLEPFSLRQSGGASPVGELSVRTVWQRSRDPQGDFESGVVYCSTVEELERSWVKVALQRLGFDAAHLYERRRHVRARASVAATLHLGETQAAVQLADLGMGGALVVSTVALEELGEGASLLLEVAIQSGAQLPARVVYHRDNDAGLHHYGLCFEKDRFTQSQARLIEGYLQALHGD